MSINERDLPKGPVGFSITTRVLMGDYEGDLELTAGSLNDLRKAVRLLPDADIEPVGMPRCGRPRRKGSRSAPGAGSRCGSERKGDTWYSHNAGGESEELWRRG